MVSKIVDGQSIRENSPINVSRKLKKDRAEIRKKAEEYRKQTEEQLKSGEGGQEEVADALQRIEDRE